MFCQNCGTEGPTTNAYCKRCGEWLPDLKASRVKWGGETPEQHLKIMLFLNGFSAVAALFSAILLYTTLPGGMKWPVALSAALCVSIAAWQLSTFFIGLKLRRRLQRGREENTLPLVLKEAKPTPALSAADTSQFIGARSVAENTTELLTPLPEGARGEKR